MQGVPGTGPGIQEAAVVRHRLRSQLDLIWSEVIGPLVRRVEDRIIEIVVETVERVRDAADDLILLEIRETGLVLVGYLDALVDALREERRGDEDGHS